MKISNFSDAQQHGEAVRGWQNCYYQTAPGKLATSLSEVALPGIHVFREYFSHNVAQYGTAPAAAFSFAVLGAGPAKSAITREQPTNAVYAVTGSAEYALHVVGHGDMIAVVIDERDWWSAAEVAHPALAKRRYPGGAVHCDARAYPGAVGQLRDLFADALANPAMLSGPGLQKVFRDSVLCALFDLQPGESDNRRDVLNQSVRADVVRRCRDLALELAARGEPTTVLDMCRACRMCRRAIQTSFLRETGVTPLAYVRAIRLNEVRVLLTSSAHASAHIGDLAARFGFFHLSHFAADYRRLFGELPSDTLRSTRSYPGPRHNVRKWPTPLLRLPSSRLSPSCRPVSTLSSSPRR